MESQRSADDDVGPYIFPDLSTCNFDECRGALDAIGACKLRWRPSYSIHYSKNRKIQTPFNPGRHISIPFVHFDPSSLAPSYILLGIPIYCSWRVFEMESL